MSVNVSSAINRVFQEFDTTLMSAFNTAPRLWPAYGMEVPSSARSTMHAWLGDQSTVQEWLGKRKAKSMGTRYWEVINRNWELTYEFEVNQILDDLSGLTSSAISRARSNGVKWARHEDLLVAATLEAGPSTLCYDGQDFFATSHPVDVEGITSGTFGNLITTNALTYANFDTTLTRMHSFKLEDGAPMVPPGTKLYLIHPPALRTKAWDICRSPYVTPGTAYGLAGTGGASPNPFIGLAEPLENAWLTSTTTWYLSADDAGMKPVMFQRRQDVESLELGVGSQLYFDEKKVRIGTDARYAASYTFPQLCIQNTA